MKTIYDYNQESHTHSCTYVTKHKVYRGEAKCHEDDYDMESRLTGQSIASLRADIAVLIDMRDNYHNQLKSLNHLYSLYEHNNNIDINSIECHLLRNQLKRLTREYQSAREEVINAKKLLTNIISEKEQLFKKVRKIRNANKSLTS